MSLFCYHIVIVIIIVIVIVTIIVIIIVIIDGHCFFQMAIKGVEKKKTKKFLVEKEISPTPQTDEKLLKAVGDKNLKVFQNSFFCFPVWPCC